MGVNPRNTDPLGHYMQEEVVGPWVPSGGGRGMSLRSLGNNLPLLAVITAKWPTGTTPQTSSDWNKLCVLVSGREKRGRSFSDTCGDRGWGVWSQTKCRLYVYHRNVGAISNSLFNLVAFFF